MQQLSCELIADLLPRYAENMCGEQSRAAVEEHLKGCPTCREKLKQIKSAQVQQNPAEAAAVEKPSKTQKSKKLNVWPSVLCVGIYVLAFFLLGNMRNWQILMNAEGRIVPIYFLSFYFLYILFGVFTAFLANQKKNSVKTVLLELFIIDIPALFLMGNFLFWAADINGILPGVLGQIFDSLFQNTQNLCTIGAVILGCEIYRFIFKRK